jgi:hypothetical protein
MIFAYAQRPMIDMAANPKMKATYNQNFHKPE